jgi:hypothetical protein
MARSGLAIHVTSLNKKKHFISFNTILKMSEFMENICDLTMNLGGCRNSDTLRASARPFSYLHLVSGILFLIYPLKLIYNRIRINRGLSFSMMDEYVYLSLACAAFHFVTQSYLNNMTIGFVYSNTILFPVSIIIDRMRNSKINFLL